MKIAIAFIVALVFSGCAISGATLLIASATAVGVAEDAFSIATKYREFKAEYIDNNDSK
jgi:hypothetical protein